MRESLPGTGARAGRDHGDIAAVRRAVAVLECFDFEHPEQTVASVSIRLDVASSTAHRLLRSLTDVGLLERPARGRYRLGLRAYEMGQAAVLARAWREQGRPHLERLRQQTGHTAQLAILDGTDVVFLDRLEDSAVYRRFGMAGVRMPAHASSSGKALLAFGAPEATVAAIELQGFTRRAARTVTSRALFREMLAHTRAHGYAESLEETAADIASVAAPVLDRSGRAVAALSVAGITARFDAEARQRAARLAVTEATALGAQMRGLI